MIASIFGKATSICGKELTAEIVKMTHQHIMMKRYEPTAIDAIALADLSICERYAKAKQYNQ